MDLKQANKARWDVCHISADKGPAFKKVADVLVANKDRYQMVSDVLAKQGHTVPWFFIAVVHYRESGFDKQGQPRFDTYLGNGQSLKRKTTIVPKDRGPFNSWEAGAVDALVYAPPYAAQNDDWSIGGTLAKLEEYNGLGYFNMGKSSPYIWAGTDEYTQGKYTSDGKYDPNTVDQQLGCAGLLKFMGAFKTAPTGAGTLTGAVAVGGAATAMNYYPHVLPWLKAHWMPVLAGVVGAAIALDIMMIIYNKHKNKLKVNNGNA